MTPQQFTDDVVLAALNRAARHSHPDRQVAGTSLIASHLAISTRSGAWRQVRRKLDDLEAVGLVEQSRYLGMTAWGLTPAARERLRTFEVVLPESPQHRAWRVAREIAGQDMGRFRAELAEALRDALALVDSEAPAHSDVWIGLGKRLQREARRLASATHCLGEWAEPDDAIAEAATIEQRSLRSVVLHDARRLTVSGVVMRWTIDIHAGHVIVVLAPTSALNRKALEAVTLDVERIFDQRVASGASTSANFQAGCIDVDIAVDAITVSEIALKLNRLEQEA